MVTLMFPGGTALRVQGKNQKLLIFPKDPAQKNDDDLVLLAAPEEEPGAGCISWPGEYDVSGIPIRGVGHSEGQQVSYRVDLDNVRFAFLSSPLCDFEDHDLEFLGEIDVLVLPAEKPHVAQKLVDRIDPRLLILLLGGSKDAKDALEVCGAADKKPEKEYKIKGALPQEGREVVVLAG